MEGNGEGKVARLHLINPLKTWSEKFKKSLKKKLFFSNFLLPPLTSSLERTRA